LAQYPTFRDWVVNNLTEAQLDALCQAPRSCLNFGLCHPLNDQKFAAGLFRAYRSDVIHQIKYEFKSYENFLMTHRWGRTNDATNHSSVVWAVALMEMEFPEIYQEISDARQTSKSV
jgi:hypothetical protein